MDTFKVAPVERKPLHEWVAAPRWILEHMAGNELCAQLNLNAWAVEGPRLCWPEDLKELELLRSQFQAALDVPDALRDEPSPQMRLIEG